MLNGLTLTWSWNPVVIILFVIPVLLYMLGLGSAHLRAQRDPEQKPVHALQVVAFFAGILLAAFLLLSPVNTIARTQLFSLHMTQAVILTTVCSPLILFGCPAILLRPLIEIPVVREIVRLLTFPIVASVLFNLTFLVWHAPRLYDAAVLDANLYHAMMLTIFFTSVLNWYPLIGSLPELRNMSYPLQMLYAFFDGQPVDIFAFILVFSGVTIYTGYTVPPQMDLPGFGDQAVGGALLLIPGLVDLGVMSPLFLRWLGQLEHKTRLADQRRQEELMQEDDDFEEDDEEISFENHSQA